MYTTHNNNNHINYFDISNCAIKLSMNLDVGCLRYCIPNQCIGIRLSIVQFLGASPFHCMKGLSSKQGDKPIGVIRKSGVTAATSLYSWTPIDSATSSRMVTRTGLRTLELHCQFSPVHSILTTHCQSLWLCFMSVCLHKGQQDGLIQCIW